MRVAVVTSTFNTRTKWLDQCHESVIGQTVPCTHFIVNDGGDRQGVERHFETAQILHIPGPHQDGGNAARAMGGMEAICDRYDAITYLDSDNWYAPTHIETLVGLAASTGASVISSGRVLYTPEGELLGDCPEINPEFFIDASCMLFTKPAFGCAAYWACIPERYKYEGDRYIWKMVIQNAALLRAHSNQNTVNFRTLYKCHYRHFGKPFPEGVKDGPSPTIM